MRLAVEIALTHLRSRKRQTLVSVAGVAMGVGFFVAMAALMLGFREDFVRRIIDTAPHIVMKDEFRVPDTQPVFAVYRTGAVRLRSVKPVDEVRGIKRAKVIVESLARWPGIAVAPTLEGQLFLRFGSKEVGASVIGIEPDRERQVTKIEKDIVKGSLDRLKTASNGIILGSGLIRKLGIGMNDTVTAVSPVGVILKMKVVGVFKTGIVAVDESNAYVLLKKNQILQNRTNVINQVRMKVDRVHDARAIAVKIERRYRYKTVSWQEQNEGVMGIFGIQDMVRYSVTGAILVVACFGIFNIISTVIFEKSRDIAILKSMGFREADIRRVFLTEGLILGILGSIAGWGLGYGLIAVLASLEFKVESIVELQGFVLAYSVWHYVQATVASVIAATLAAYLPARRAARLKPVDIIRGAQ